MMAGGARYNFGSVSLTGAGTLIDSLYAVRRVVYERGLVSLAELGDMLAADFAGAEPFRQHLINRVPKFGREDEAVRSFSARVFADLARVSSGRENTRGGRYEASLFSFRTFADMARGTGATPDGRKADEHLSPGMSPSLLSLGRRSTVGQVLSALEPLDLTLYPVVAVLDVKLPACAPGRGAPLLTPVIRRFLDAGGSVLQVNCVDAAMLLEARAHPERHPDLVVRISGYSAYFNTLSEELKDEVIGRTSITT
jgi:formate C-acetyltransferase